MTRDTNGGWIEEVPGVEIELLENGNVRATDKSDPSQDYSVDLHPMHLRLIAEKLGLVREMSVSEADALRTVNKLQRRIKLLADRINHLGHFLALYSDSKHADLSYEQNYATATADLADEFVREIDESGAVVKSHGTSRHVTMQSTVTSGVTPKSQGANALVAGECGRETTVNPAGSQQAARAEQQLSLEVGHG